MKVFKNYNLTEKNTLKLQSSCEQYIELTNKEDIATLLSLKDFSRDNFFILGEGSNVILPETFNGTVLHPKFLGIQEHVYSADKQKVSVGAGESWSSLIAYTLSAGLLGLENLTLIPGSVGAAPIQNIGAYGVEVCECIESVEVFNFNLSTFETLLAKDCDFSYRESVFKRNPTAYLIISVNFLLNKKAPLNCSYAALKKRIQELGLNELELTQIQLSQIVATIRTERLPDPVKLPNAGSFFKNPVVTQHDFDRLIKQFPDLVFFPQQNNSIKLSAAWLIDFCGWKGCVDGNLQVSEQHALVIINNGKAKKNELLVFAKRIQDDVYHKFSVHLEIEPVVKPY